jgi:hypothetical protein
MMGVMSAGAMIAAPLGMLTVGPAIDRMGLPGTFIVVSTMLIAVFLMIAFNRTIRTIDATDEAVAAPETA